MSNKLSTNSTYYELPKYNHQIYNKYLNQRLQKAKTGYYAREFTKYKGDIRKTWDTLKDILNKKRGQSKFPSYLFWSHVKSY